ncbi:neural cell adhesion molecule 2-like isoform X1 [Rhagoletis pomonella]|uniref:neural cell adhesion molecule 2-like isoform X1 n=1 Tax=Rhagoletis pomonella TaxID=28610 RepID=UPI00177DB2B8|nr:neural cell adhesion molecule 2-like isoform X1 [Rhagoletis pomonella]
MKSNSLILAIFITTLCLQYSPAASAEAAATTDGDTDYARDDYYYEDDADADENDDGGGEEGDDYEDEVSNGEAADMKPAELRAQPPYFVEPEVEIYTQPAQSLLIDCAVQNIQANNVIMWYKDKIVIATGQFVMYPNVDVLKNNSLIIKNVTVKDAGDYYCEVLPERVRMHALLEVDESLMIFCDGQEVTNRSLVFRQGEPHHCECKYYSLENVQIKWFIDGKRAETVVERVLGEQLYIDNVDTIHGGIYQCLADDRSQEPPHAMIIVEVVYAPKVSTYRHYVNAEQGGDAELYCDYAANPAAEAKWLRNDKTLEKSRKYAFNQVTHKGRNRSILTVMNVRANDLGEYTCRVQNTIGYDETKVHILYEPEHPQLEDMEINGRTAVIHWLVRSIQPLSEAILDYKLAGSYTWSKVSVVHTHRHADSSIWKVTHEMELTPGSWHVRMRAKNTIGWSAFSAQHDFVIKDDDENYGDIVDADDLDTADAPGNMIAVASFGGSSKSTNSSGVVRSISHTMIAVSGACMLFMFQVGC